MKFKTLMVIKAVVTFLFGMPLVLAPEWLFSYFGVMLGAGGAMPARAYGSAMLGYLFLCWFARNADKSDTRKAIIMALFVYDLIGLISALYAQLTGVMNPLGWFIVFIYFFFTVGFGYFLISKK